MKTTSEDRAKAYAKAKSLEKGNRDTVIYIIFCNRTGYFYVDTNGLIRLWERLIGSYTNGVFASGTKNL